MHKRFFTLHFFQKIALSDFCAILKFGGDPMSKLITLSDYHAEAAHFYVFPRRTDEASKVLHYHDHFQISFIVSGSASHRQGTDIANLQTGDVFIIPPGFIHQIHFSSPDTTVYTLAFQDSIIIQNYPHSAATGFLRELQSKYDSGSISLRLIPDHRQKEMLSSLFECLLQEQHALCPPEFSAAHSLILSVVYLLAQCYYNVSPHSRQPWSLNDRDQLLRRCIVHIDTHYTDPLSADDIAKQFGLSRSALCSAFLQHTGLQLHKYIAQKRIQQAQLLIRSHKELPLSEIAAKVGYEDHSTFYRNFIRITGMSPTKYRSLIT